MLPLAVDDVGGDAMKSSIPPQTRTVLAYIRENPGRDAKWMHGYLEHNGKKIRRDLIHKALGELVDTGLIVYRPGGLIEATEHEVSR